MSANRPQRVTSQFLGAPSISTMNSSTNPSLSRYTPMGCVEAVPQRKQHFERQGNEPCLILWLRRSGLACETSHLLGSTQPGSFFHNESRRLRSRLRLEVFSRNEEPDFWHTPASRSFMQSAVSECSISQFFQAALHGAQITAGINF